MHIRIGTRGSRLARWQAEWVAEELRKRAIEVELIPLSTEGDRKDKGALSQLGSVGIFTREIQRALLENQVDLAVHSLKDLPTAQTEGLQLAAVPLRGPCEDVLVTQNRDALSDLPPQSRIGTGSLRRRSQLLYLRSDLQVVPIRGNVETRIKKLENGEYDGIVLAHAGLHRLGLQKYVHHIFQTSEMIPAVGQAALGLEIREADADLHACLEQINHRPTHQAILAERTLLSKLQGGCLAPVGAWAREIESNQLQLDAVVLDASGTQRLFHTNRKSMDEAKALGRETAEHLLMQGAETLIHTVRDAEHP
ncbi:MAG: hydroxymethylbilane synthase [Pirellulales bacterium]|nr:hydroxymethylbilane synthase [Pirellulales bacterium]